MNLSGGGDPQNVLVVSVGVSGATIKVTKSGTTLTKTSDTAGYAYFKNLATGTWTVSAVNSSSHTAPLTPTVTITSTQTAYFVRLGFEFWLYDNSYANATTNQCSANSGGWDAGAATMEASRIVTRGTGGGATGPNNSFNLSNYDSLAFYVSCANGQSNTITVRLSDNTLVTSKTFSSTSSTWVSLDISSFSYQTAYISVQANSNDVASIYKCYLA
jgi:hypothetical protein